MNIKSRKSKALWQGAFLVAGTCFAASVQAQVSVVEKRVPSVANDPLQLLPAASSKAKASSFPPLGLIVYPARVPVKGGPQRQPFDLIVRRVGGTAQVQATKPVAVYRATPALADVIYGPQFSPDGRYILFKSGWPYERQSTYRLYLWDIKNKKLLKGPPHNLVYEMVYWSPDSRYLAYIRGGDSSGNRTDDGKPLELYIWNLKTGQSRLLAQNPEVESLAWTHQGTLLYTFFSPQVVKEAEKAMAGDQERPAASQHPAVYEVTVEGGEARQVIAEAYGNLLYSSTPALAASPDGKWIAFYGWPDAAATAAKKDNKSGPEPQYPGLYLFNRQTKTRVSVGDFSASERDFLLWTPDSRKLIVVRTSYRDKAGKGIGEARIRTIDVATLKSEQVAVLQAQDIDSVNRSNTQPQFQSLGVSKNKPSILIKATEYIATKGRFTVDRTTLRAVELGTGKVSILARVKSFAGESIGLDWKEMASTNTSGQK